MFLFLKKSALLCYRAGDNLVENDGVELAGYLSFLELLSLFPFLVIIVATAGFFGQSELGVQLIQLLISHAPHDAVEALKPRIEEIISGPPQGLLTISILGALWTSSSAVEGFRTVLNRAYNVSEPPHYFFRRMMSILQIVLFTLILMVAMFTLVVTPLLLERVAEQTGWNLPETTLALIAEDFTYIAILAMFGAVSMLYYWLPNIKQSLLSVAPGAALVVAGWVGGAALVGFYLDNVSQVNLIYGSLSGFIATLLFFFIYGAEFNHQLQLALGKRVEEREHSAHSPDDSVIRKD
jgi:membrane protein